MKDLLNILRALTAGNVQINEDGEDKSITSRIKFELYGEYPLSADNQKDWDENISSAFNLSNYYRTRVYNKMEMFDKEDFIVISKKSKIQRRFDDWD